MRTAPGSFRDPSGQVIEKDGNIYRTITNVYRPHWEKVRPFLDALVQDHLLLPFEEVEPLAGAWKTLRVERLPFISYPYEWSFHQLRDAALLTLELQRRALSHGLILKDASAYNVQFIGKRPVFIDLLSFEPWEEGAPWVAYRQFCTHFLAPLALMATDDLRCGLLSRLWIDGIPLDVAASMLPRRKKWNPGLNFHIFLHARLQNKYADSGEETGQVKSAKVTAAYLKNLADSLERLIRGKAMRLPEVSTEWGDYYSHTNYSDLASDHKYTIVSDMAQQAGDGRLALDLGANTGRYTQAIAPFFRQVIAADIDPQAVNRHYETLKAAKGFDNILPLIMDFSNPSPGIGFSNAERTSFIDRCDADFAIALALIHHLRITAGIPLALIAEFFASLLGDKGVLVLEFVPKEDSQTRKLLASREDIFSDYTLDQCIESFSPYFTCEKVVPIEDTCRNILLLRKKG